MSIKSDAALEYRIPILDEQSFIELLVADESSSPIEPTEIPSDLRDIEEFGLDSTGIWSELVFLSSLLLKSAETIVPLVKVAEDRNEWAEKILRFLSEDPKKIFNSLQSAGEYWPTEQLPDVCGSCYRSFGLTFGGRYRLSCVDCKGEASRMALERLMAMHRLCLRGEINRSVLAQIIYKYYSHNGDKSWQILKTLPDNL